MSESLILCATDLHQSGAEAARLAAHLGKRLGAKLVLIHVTDLPSESELNMLGLDSHVDVAAEALKKRVLQRKENAEAKLRELAAECATHCPTKLELHDGRPADALVARADELDAQLIVVGQHTRSDSILREATERLMGTTAARVVRHSHRPVLVAAGDVMQALEGLETAPRVVVGHELSSGGDAALQLVAKLFGEEEEVTVVHVLQDPFSPDDAPLDWASIRKQWATELRERLDAVVGGASVPAKGKVVSGPPAAALSNEASERDAHLLVVGAHAGGRLSRWLLGSTAERVIRMADRPVLVVPPPGAEP